MMGLAYHSAAVGADLFDAAVVGVVEGGLLKISVVGYASLTGLRGLLPIFFRTASNQKIIPASPANHAGSEQ